MNEVILTGRLGRNAETKKIADSERSVVKFAMCVRGDRKDKDGNTIDLWVEVVYWTKSLGIVPYLVKGQQVGVSGRLDEERWTDKDGNERRRNVVVAGRLELLGDAKKNAEVADKAEVPVAKTPDDFVDAPF